jgi:hypothetical protein
VEPSQSPDPESVKQDIVALAAEDLQARTDALKDTMPDRVRRRVIAWQSVEILTGLIRRRLLLPEDGE